MSARGCNIKQLTFTLFDSWVISGQQLPMGSEPGRHYAFVPWLTVFESRDVIRLLKALGPYTNVGSTYET
ncbi:hypothetical protein TNCV_2467001 [Trichonephila clavipes]|nr:hypothetical protein TNCV_2467001 [Trichonephila clavipes]